MIQLPAPRHRHAHLPQALAVESDHSHLVALRELVKEGGWAYVAVTLLGV